MFTLYKKNRKFELPAHYGKETGEKKRKIVFERLPRKKVKPIWWLIVVFVFVLYLLNYLSSF